MIDNHPSDLEPETILNETREAAERLGRRLLRRRGALLRGWRLRNGRFEEHLYVVWAEPLDYYELCLYLANKCGAFFNKSYGAQAALENNSKFYALIRLHSGATRVAGEIYALLLSGYPSGAYARWRTLHEISVTAMFVAQESKEVAERYIDHQAIKDYEDMKNYAKYEPSVPNKVAGLAGIEKLCRELLQVYGNDFRRPYGWAHPVIKKRLALSKGQRIGFEHLQAAVQIEHWSPWYRMASHAVHPTATFLHRNIGLRDELDDEVLLAGRSDFGLADPGQALLCP